ncbi:MAG: acetyl-CoA carboxylase biotin carboxyl carrier protein [Nitrospirota bacterium]|nr:acetyl-CoA carboxylase biotin carboxyl carrier protein [Nitrospirota bacterium]
MELDEIKKLVKIIQDTDITEFVVEREGVKLKIKREKVMQLREAAAPAVQHMAAAVPEIIREEAPSPAAPNYVTVTSPIVGIFYTASSPESPPFVSIGSSVRKGQVLCIVEAMKLMNEIECDTDGTIVKILVENGQPVEYGKPLFHIEPAS